MTKIIWFLIFLCIIASFVGFAPQLLAIATLLFIFWIFIIILAGIIATLSILSRK